MATRPIDDSGVWWSLGRVIRHSGWTAAEVRKYERSGKLRSIQPGRRRLYHSADVIALCVPGVRGLFEEYARKAFAYYNQPVKTQAAHALRRVLMEKVGLAQHHAVALEGLLLDAVQPWLASNREPPQSETAAALRGIYELPHPAALGVMFAEEPGPDFLTDEDRASWRKIGEYLCNTDFPSIAADNKRSTEAGDSREGFLLGFYEGQRAEPAEILAVTHREFKSKSAEFQRAYLNGVVNSLRKRWLALLLARGVDPVRAGGDRLVSQPEFSRVSGLSRYRVEKLRDSLTVKKLGKRYKYSERQARKIRDRDPEMLSKLGLGPAAPGG